MLSQLEKERRMVFYFVDQLEDKLQQDYRSFYGPFPDKFQNHTGLAGIWMFLDSEFDVDFQKIL